MAYTVGQTQNVQVPNYSGVNIQIFNPSVAAPGAAVPGANVNAQTYTTNSAYPANYYTQNLAQPPSPPPEEKKETEKREVVQLTDDYIRTLESYLDDKEDKDVRLMGAKEVLARLQEDESRKNDEGLNNLINKMLQDKYAPVRFIAMSALESGVAAGNEKSVELLKKIQEQKTNNEDATQEDILNVENSLKKEDALKASKILLRMSSNTIEKEFDVKNKTQA